MSIVNDVVVDYIPSHGNAGTSHFTIGMIPIWMSICGARKTRKAMQSRYEIWLRIIVMVGRSQS